MALPHPIDEPRETFMHVVARDFQWLLRVLCVIMLIATAITMATFWFWAIIPAIILLFLYTLLVIAGGIEHRTDHEPHGAAEPAEQPAAAPVDPDSLRARRRDDAVEKRVTRVALEVLGGAIVLGGAMAYWHAEPKLVAVAALVLVSYVLLVSAPAWLAWMEQDAQEEVVRHRSR